MIYKTKGVCSQAIEVEVDGDTVKSVRGRMQWKYQRNRTAGSWHEGGRCDCQTGRNHLWLQANFLSGSACQSAERDQGAAVVLTAA